MNYTSLICGLILCLVNITHASSTNPAKLQNAQFVQEGIYYEVEKIVDGDTFWLTDGKGKKEKVRFIGIDAPETRNTRNKTKSPFGKVAKLYVELQLKGKKVRVEFDVQRTDRYQRTLAYIYLPDGSMLNEMIVSAGYAVATSYPPNVKYQNRLLRAERTARQHKKGMWATDIF